MPTKYDISPVNEITSTCRYCGGQGYQFVQGLGYRACQYCGKPTCPNMGIRRDPSHTCEICAPGILHEFHSDLQGSSPVILPNTPARPFAGEPGTAPLRILTRGRR